MTTPPPQRPPPQVLLAYRFFGWRLGPTHSDWVLDDILRKGWLVRQGSPAVASILVLGAIINSALGGDPKTLVSVLVIVLIAGAFQRGSLRDRALRQQGIDESGQQLESATWYVNDDQRIRRNLVSALSTTTLIIAALVLLALRHNS